MKLEKAYQEVQDYRLPMHYAYKVFCCVSNKQYGSVIFRLVRLIIV